VHFVWNKLPPCSARYEWLVLLAENRKLNCTVLDGFQTIFIFFFFSSFVAVRVLGVKGDGGGCGWLRRGLNAVVLARSCVGELHKLLRITNFLSSGAFMLAVHRNGNLQRNELGLSGAAILGPVFQNTD
jgi:hypothetical protein